MKIIEKSYCAKQKNFLLFSRREALTENQIPTNMKRIIKTTTPRTEFFNGIAQPVVTAIWNDETQTTEAANSIKYVGGKFEHVVNPTIRIKA